MSTLAANCHPVKVLRNGGPLTLRSNSERSRLINYSLKT